MIVIVKELPEDDNAGVGIPGLQSPVSSNALPSSPLTTISLISESPWSALRRSRAVFLLTAELSLHCRYMAQRIEDELASERAKVNALQEEIARLRHELQSTPPSALPLLTALRPGLLSRPIRLLSPLLESRGRGGPLSPASQPPRIRPEPLQSSPLAATSPARTSTGGPGTLVAPRTPLHTSTQSHSTPASRRETPPPPTASASHQWQGQRPSRGSPRVSSSPGTRALYPL